MKRGEKVKFIEPTFYRDDEIMALKRKYRLQTVFSKISNFLIAMYFPLINIIFGESGTFSYVDKAGVLHYICGVTRIILFGPGLLLLLCIMTIIMNIHRRKLGGKITEYLVAQKAGNINKKKRLYPVIFQMGAGFIIAISFGVFCFSSSTRISVSEYQYTIHGGSRYSAENGTFYLAETSNIEVLTNSFDSTKTLSFQVGDNNPWVNIGTSGKYQNELLQFIDEITNRKYHLLKSGDSPKS